MISIRTVLLFAVMMSAFGCTAVTVRPVETELEIKHVCIEDGREMCFDGEMLGVIRDGFERHGITSEVYKGGVVPSECEYHLTYMCNQTWDLAMYLHHAELRLYHGRDRIGYAEYHLKGQGGLALNKLESTDKKMNPIIDELLKSFPIVNPD